MKHLVVFTMKGCPHCGEFKTMLEENNITFYEHDIDEHNEEYEMFVQITENEFVPAFMVIDEGEIASAKCFAPDSNFQTLEEALEIVQKEII